MDREILEGNRAVIAPDLEPKRLGDGKDMVVGDRLAPTLLPPNAIDAKSTPRDVIA